MHGLKISHNYIKVVTGIITLLYGKFCNKVPLIISYGIIHGYPGMMISYSEVGKVKITMIN